ncbi:MAG: Stk1 family PASTA domain-containing Ser/Thr kinase [Lachnospiraceae bacterium]|nr:Stk1 family PASTA domain-containing Ser/Thr kinase [Lachnospiraceae bacterium]
MIKIGMTVAERYEVLEKIGTGGMSDVYRAKDHKLNRFVAIKVLKQEFSENKEFLQKFRSEAQSAAGLMHPNIVNVYDVGEENGSHFIVMELVEGITLKKYIEKKARLSVREAVSIAIQVAQGIEAAHNNHIIHRDIKPQNVIISMDGKVKVTDFGIAKAATSNTITSNVMGSVHYTSPEQVRGGFSDEKSDIYSLGITLFEMITGRVPFNGETTVAVAIKHIQEPMPSPRDYVPEIPISLEKIVLKCTQKSPDRRYQSAPELIEDLKKSLISPDEDFVKLDDVDEGGVTKDISEQEIKRIRQQAKRRDSFDAQMSPVPEALPPEEDPYYGEELPPEEGEYAEGYEGYDEGYDYYPEEGEAEMYPEELPQEPPRRKKKPASGKNGPRKKPGADSRTGRQNPPGKQGRGPAQPASGRKQQTAAQQRSRNAAQARSNRRDRRYGEEDDPRMELLTTVLIIIAGLVVAGIFFYLVIQFLPSMEGGKGKPTPTAAPTSAADGSGDGNPAGTEDASPTPQDGQGSGAGNVQVPDVTKRIKAEATATLENNGFTVEVFRENSADVPKDQVIRQEPAAGSSVAIGSTVTITVSLGKESISVTMPELKGKTEAEAQTLLGGAGLTATRGADEYNDQYPEGTVCYQNYSGGVTVSTDSEVEYRISKGPEPAFYNVNTVVNAPADYAGGNARVLLKTESGDSIFETTTDVFPVPIIVSALDRIPRGILTIEYMVNETQEIRDEEGNVTVQQVQISKTSDPVTIEFTKSQ